MVNAFRKINYNSSLLAEYKGSYEAVNTYAGGYRNQRISLEKIKNLKNLIDIRVIKVSGRNVLLIDVDSPEVLISIFKLLKPYISYNLFVIVEIKNDKIDEFLMSTRFPIDMLIVESKNEELMKKYPNVFIKPYERKPIDLKDVTFEELEKIRFILKNEIRTSVFIKDDFDNLKVLKSVKDTIDFIKKITIKTHDLSDSSVVSWCPYEMYFGETQNANYELIEVIKNIEASKYPDIDVYVVDLLNESGYIPDTMICECLRGVK